MHSETQKTLVSRLTHLFTAGHPKHVEAEALRLITERDSTLVSRVSPAQHLAVIREKALAEAQRRADIAEALVDELRRSLCFIRDECDWEDDERIGATCGDAIGKTTDGMGAELARLREVNALRVPGSCECGDDDLCAIAKERDAIRARVAELQRECDRLAKREAEMTFDLDSENARIAALVAAIEGSLEEITEEINPSNYNHDVVCKIAREMDACLSGLQKALDAAKPGAAPHPDTFDQRASEEASNLRTHGLSEEDIP